MNNEDKKEIKKEGGRRLPPPILLFGSSVHPSKSVRIRCDGCLKGKCDGKKHRHDGESFDENGVRVVFKLVWRAYQSGTKDVLE